MIDGFFHYFGRGRNIYISVLGSRYRDRETPSILDLPPPPKFSTQLGVCIQNEGGSRKVDNHSKTFIFVYLTYRQSCATRVVYSR